MIAILLQQELVGHAGDVIANDDVTSDGERGLLVIGRHGTQFLEIKIKKLRKAIDRTVAIFGDDWIAIEIRNQKTFQMGVFGGDPRTHSGDPLWPAPDFFGGAYSGLLGASSSIGDCWKRV